MYDAISANSTNMSKIAYVLAMNDIIDATVKISEKAVYYL